MDICPKCGLPKEACSCEKLASGEEKIRIRKEKRKFGKIVTVIEFTHKTDLKKIAKELKTELACGGTAKERVIELQGDHVKKVRDKLIKLGFPSENIE